MSSLGIQLYSVRNALEHDFVGTIHKLASFGYAGVEFAGCPGGISYEQCLKVVKEAGLQIPSMHVPVPSGPNRNLIFDNAYLMGCRYLVSGKWIDDFKTVDAIKRSCDDFNRGAEEAEKNGFKLAIHNHWAEFEPVDGVPAYQHMLKYLDPKVLFEIDTYWLTVAGQNAADVVSELKERAPLLHIKDGSGKPNDFKLKAVGQGVMNFAPVFRQAKNAEWLICEIDDCETDMLQAIKESYDYIKRNQ